MRRVADIVIAVAVLLLTLPLIAAVAFAIRYEGAGPILEFEDRIGIDGRRFKLLKFRTVLYDPECTRPAWAREITQVGQFLRYTRMDTLPQLVNVLRGDVRLIDTARDPRVFPD